MKRYVIAVLLLIVTISTGPSVKAAGQSPWPEVEKRYAITHDGASALADVSPDGRLILFRSHIIGPDPGSLWLTTRSGSPRRELVGHGAGMAFFARDSRSIFYSASGILFHRIDLQGHRLPGTLSTRGLSWLPAAGEFGSNQPTWLPDGRLAFGRGRHLIAVDPRSGRRGQYGKASISHYDGLYGGDLLSPNRRYVATVSDTAPAAVLIEDVATGRAIIRVPVTESKSWEPEAWWPDSRSLFLFNGFNWQEARLDLPSGRLTRVPALDGGIQAATWSPDGSTMAFSRHPMGSCVYVMPVFLFRMKGDLGPRGDLTGTSDRPIWTGDGKALISTLVDHISGPCGLPRSDVWITPLK